MTTITDKIAKRFWKKVSIGGLDECWNWNAGLSHGYGSFHISPTAKPRRLLAHRLAFEIVRNVPTKGSDVLHQCDNPLCVNPIHLSLGSQRDNVLDCVAKKRHAFGERNGHARLTEKQVMEIRSRYCGSVSKLAREFGVSPATICDIGKRRSWRHL